MDIKIGAFEIYCGTLSRCDACALAAGYQNVYNYTYRKASSIGQIDKCLSNMHHFAICILRLKFVIKEKWGREEKQTQCNQCKYSDANWERMCAVCTTEYGKIMTISHSTLSCIYRRATTLTELKWKREEKWMSSQQQQHLATTILSAYR